MKEDWRSAAWGTQHHNQFFDHSAFYSSMPENKTRKPVDNKSENLKSKKTKDYKKRFDNIQFPPQRVRRIIRVVEQNELANGEWPGVWRGMKIEFIQRFPVQHTTHDKINRYQIEYDGYGTGQDVLVVVRNHQIEEVRML